MSAPTIATGYRSYSKTKEEGSAPQTIPAGTWVDVDHGMIECPTDNSNHISAQLYFEEVIADRFSKMAVRTKRDNPANQYTGQDDRIVRGPVWAINYHDDDYVKEPFAARGIQVWSEYPCKLYTRNVKVTRPVTAEGKVA